MREDVHNSRVGEEDQPVKAQYFSAQYTRHYALFTYNMSRSGQEMGNYNRTASYICTYSPIPSHASSLIR